MMSQFAVPPGRDNSRAAAPGPAAPLCSTGVQRRGSGLTLTHLLPHSQPHAHTAATRSPWPKLQYTATAVISATATAAPSPRPHKTPPRRGHPNTQMHAHVLRIMKPGRCVCNTGVGTLIAALEGSRGTALAETMVNQRSRASLLCHGSRAHRRFPKKPVQ